MVCSIMCVSTHSCLHLFTSQYTVHWLCVAHDSPCFLQTLEGLCSGLEEQLAQMEDTKEGEEGEGGGENQAWVSVVERALKSTVLGGLLLPLLVVVGDKRVCTLQMANMLQKSLHPLVQLVAQVWGVKGCHVIVTWCSILSSLAVLNSTPTT